MSKTGKGMGLKELRRKVNVWNLGTQTCQLSQKHVNALSVPVTPSSPPVQSSASSAAPSSVAAFTWEDLRMMAVPSFSFNVENGESSCLDTGSEEHVCNPDFL